MFKKTLKLLILCFGFGLIYLVVLSISIGLLLLSFLFNAPHLTGSEVSTKDILIPSVIFIAGIAFFSFLQYKSVKSLLGQEKKYILFILIATSWVLAFLMSQVFGIKIG